MKNLYNTAMDNRSLQAPTIPSYGKGLIFLAVGLLLLGWLLNTPEGLLGKADAVGYAVCHRIDVRSLHLGERQLPLCARCSGMFLGALLGMTYQAVASRRRAGMPPRSLWILLGAFVVAFGVDGLNSYISLFPGDFNVYEPQNWLRLLTGTGMGLAIGAVLYPAFNQTVWREWQPVPALDWRKMIVLILLALLMDALALTENPLILYPLALLSAGSVLMLLTMVYTMIWLMVFRAENRFQRFSQLTVFLVAGFGIGLLQIVALDLVRYLLTGTWDGFHFG